MLQKNKVSAVCPQEGFCLIQICLIIIITHSNTVNTVTQYLIKYVTNAHNKIANQKRTVI